MTEDILKSLGFLSLGSRFKRLGDQLQADTQRLLDELDASIQSSQHPFLAALDRLGPLTVGELAQAIGITQPGVTRNVSRLTELGLVESRPARDDQRQRIVSLTRKGRAIVDRAKREVWPRIEAAVGEVCGDLSGPLLAQLATIEDRLAAAPLEARRKQEGKQS
jgi:DNA-binding MarR family transcriptional regulator